MLKRYGRATAYIKLIYKLQYEIIPLYMYPDVKDKMYINLNDNKKKKFFKHANL